MRKLLRIVALVVLAIVALLVAGGALFAFEVFSRKPLRAVPSTTHALGRQACISLSVGAVKIRLHRARAKLHDELRRRCWCYTNERGELMGAPKEPAP